MKKGTVIYIGGFRMPDGNAAAQRVLANSKLLKDMGYNVVFIDVNDDCSESIKNTKHDVRGYDGWSIKYPRSTFKWFSYIVSIDNFKAVEREYSDIAMVIAYNYPAAAMKKLTKYCHKRGYKIVADCTEWYERSKNIIKNLDSDLRMKKYQPRLDGIIAISRFLYDYYREQTKTVYLPPLTDIKDSKWKNKADAADNGRLSFVYAGSPGRGKDKLQYVIGALSELGERKRYMLNVVGITKEQYLSDYPEDAAVIEGLKDNVRFRGRVTHEEAVSNVLNSTFSVFFRPDTLTTRAGFPTKYVEAVTCGTPVITNRTSDLSDYIRDGENAILIDGYEKKDIKAAFERVFAMTHEQIAAIKAECESERDKFDYRKYKDRMNTFIDEVLSKK